MRSALIPKLILLGTCKGSNSPVGSWGASRDLPFTLQQVPCDVSVAPCGERLVAVIQTAA